MASLSNINGLFDVHSTGAILFSTSHGTSGQILKSNGNAAPTWVDASTVIGGPYLPLSGGTLTGATATASGISFTVGGDLTVGDATATNQGLRIESGNGTGDYGVVRFKHGSTNRNTIHAFSQYWQSGTIYTAATDSLNFDGHAGVTIGPWNNIDVAFVQGGASYFKNNVGIGVTNPSDYYSTANDLVVGGSSNHGITIATGTTSTGALHFADGTSGAAEYAGYIAYQHNDNKMRFGINASDKLVIDSSGDVTIQTSGADDIKNLTINSSNGSSQVAGFVIQNDGANGYIHFKAGAGNATPTTKLTIGNAANSGNVGIGTTSPSTLLHILGNSNSSDNILTLTNTKYGSTNTTGETGIIFGWSNHIAARITAFKEGTVNRTGFKIIGEAGFNVPTTIATFRSTGNVGIGTSSPTQPLDVNGYAQVDKLIQRDNSTTVNLLTPRILNIGYRGANGTYTFNPVTLFGSLAQGGQCTLEVTGWRGALNNGIIHWADNGSNTNIGAGQVYYTQTAYRLGGQSGSNTISVATNSGTNNITITFTGWHTNSHGWNCKIISYQA